MLTLPVIRFCPFLRLAYALIIETNFPKPSVLFQTFRLGTNVNLYQTKQMYRGMFEIQKSGNKTSSELRTHASPKVGQDQVFGGVSVLCWHASPVANVLWKPHQITSGWPLGHNVYDLDTEFCICSNVEMFLNLSYLRTFWVSDIPRYFYFASKLCHD